MARTDDGKELENGFLWTVCDSMNSPAGRTKKRLESSEFPVTWDKSIFNGTQQRRKGREKIG
jgi:hypothetical protein